MSVEAILYEDDDEFFEDDTVFDEDDCSADELIASELLAATSENEVEYYQDDTEFDDVDDDYYIDDTELGEEAFDDDSFIDEPDFIEEVDDADEYEQLSFTDSGTITVDPVSSASPALKSAKRVSKSSKKKVSSLLDVGKNALSNF